MSTASSFIIKELTGRQRKLELRGRALPYRGMKLEGKMRAEFTWYPGYAKATVQMLGAEEAPTTIEGMWKEKFIGQIDDDGRAVIPTAIILLNNQQVLNAVEACKAVDSIRLGGQELQVEWDEQVRRGILVRFAQAWDRREDVKWEMEFQWISRGEEKDIIALPLNVATDDLLAQLKNAITSLLAKISAPFNAVEAFTKRLNQNTTAIVDALNEIESASVNATEKILSPVDAAQRSLAASQTIGEAANDIIESVEGTVARAVMNVADIATLTYADALVADKYTRDLAKSAKEIKYVSAVQSDTLTAIVEKEDLLAAFVARGPTDLRDIATQFYGTPNEWRRLLRYNSFSSSKVTAGQTVLVPKLDFLETGT